MFVRADRTRRGLGRAILESGRLAALAEGFGALTLMATPPGVPLYRSFGFTETARVTVRLPDGVELAGVVVDRRTAELSGSGFAVGGSGVTPRLGHRGPAGSATG